MNMLPSEQPVRMSQANSPEGLPPKEEEAEGMAFLLKRNTRIHYRYFVAFFIILSVISMMFNFHKMTTLHGVHNQLIFKKDDNKVVDVLSSEGTFSVPNHDCYGDGLILIPKHKLAICLLPKVATTTLKFVSMVLGDMDPTNVCGYPHEEWGCMGGQINNHKHPFWANTKWARNEDPTLVAEIMSKGSDWKSIATIREPWSRTVSAFWEDNYKEDLRKNPEQFVTSKRNCTLIGDFDNWLQRKKETCHRLQQTAFCGLGHPSFLYDHVFDLSNGFDGLEDVLRDTTAQPRMASGWENCTVGQSPSLYGAKITSPHIMGAGNLTYWTNQFCNKDIEPLFQSRYSKDIEMYRKYFPNKSIGCVPYAEDIGCKKQDQQ